MNLSIFTVFLKNRNLISKIKRSKVTDYAALIKTFKIILYSQRALLNVIIFIIPIIIFINLSKFLKIQTNKMACKPNRLRSACALVHADSKDSDQTMSIFRLIGVLAVCSCTSANSSQSSKLGYLPTHYVTVQFCSVKSLIRL